MAQEKVTSDYELDHLIFMCKIAAWSIIVVETIIFASLVVVLF